MNRAPQTWYLERTAPVRADADGLFLNAADLPDAAIGDVVVVSGQAGGEMRAGTIAAASELDHERFYRLELRE